MNGKIQLGISWEKKDDAIKQLYALYVADNAITFQKVAIFFAVNALLSNFIASLAKIDVSNVNFLLTPLGFLVGAVATSFGLTYTWIAANDVLHTHKYRVWYRDQIEKAGRGDTEPISLDLFPPHENRDGFNLLQKSKTANVFFPIFIFVGLAWALCCIVFSFFLGRFLFGL
jgi:hypothetical protein